MSDAPAITTQATNFQGINSDFDASTMSLEDLMFFVMSQQSENLDSAVRGYADQIQRRNDLMKQTNQVLSEVRYQSSNLESGDRAVMPGSMAAFFEANGIELPDTTTADPTLTTDESIANAEEILTWLDDEKPYTDDACIDGDLSPEMINKARSLGIEPKDDGDGAGQNWESSDFSSFKSEVEQKLDKLKDIKTKETMGEMIGKDLTNSGSYTKEEWDSIISSVQGFQEGLNNESQLDMIKFQSLMSKYTTSVEMLSNVMKKLSDNASAIVRNI
jgi:hypothetical protein